jgi:hypothetical protein
VALNKTHSITEAQHREHEGESQEEAKKRLQSSGVSLIVGPLRSHA